MNLTKNFLKNRLPTTWDNIILEWLIYDGYSFSMQLIWWVYKDRKLTHKREIFIFSFHNKLIYFLKNSFGWTFNYTQFKTWFTIINGFCYSYFLFITKRKKKKDMNRTQRVRKNYSWLYGRWLRQYCIESIKSVVQRNIYFFVKCMIAQRV